jgi:hypothetical protein
MHDARLPLPWSTLQSSASPLLLCLSRPRIATPCYAPLRHIVVLGHHYLDCLTHDLIHWPPVDARTLHGHHWTLLLVQPDAKSDKATVRGLTCDQRCGGLAILPDPTQICRTKRDYS